MRHVPENYGAWSTKTTCVPANKLLVCSPSGNEVLARALNVELNEVAFWYV